MTRQEARLWTRLRLLRAAGHHFRRQVPIAGFVVDFACLRAGLVVELDGGQHSRDLAAHRDRERDRQLAALGFQVLRFWNGEVDGNLDGVLETIVAALPSVADPTPARASRDSALP
jgi:very-short-patch-repair endonuclease